MKSLLPSAFAILALATTARADSYTFTLAKSGGAVSCTRSAAADQNRGAAIDVKLENGTLAPNVELYLSTSGSTPFPKAKAGTYEWHIPRDKLGGQDAELQLRDDPDPSRATVKCDPTGVLAQAADAQAGQTAPPATPESALDARAVAYWQTKGPEDLRAVARNGGFPGKTHFLVHYANGEPAAPFPESVPEGEPLQIVIVANAAQPPTASLTVNACEGVQPFRIRQAAAKTGELQGRTTAPPRFQLFTFGRTLVCGAGALSYTLRLGGVDHTQAVRIRPVYHLSATVAYGFDFVRQPTFSAQDGVIRRFSDRSGLGLRLGFTWFPLGVDYEDFRWWNWFSNVVFAVDPTAPTERFLVGTVLTPTGGFGVLVGASFERVTVLRGANVGDAFAGPGEIPTDKAWRNGGIGLYLGLSVDDNVFDAIKGRLGAGAR